MPESIEEIERRIAIERAEHLKNILVRYENHDTSHAPYFIYSPIS